MTPRDLRDLLLLAALWGGSFLFMRLAVPELGPVALIELRLLVAALFLLPVLAIRGGLGLLARHAVPMTVLGVVNSALPFCLFAYAMISVTAGFASILNATTPMWGAIVARLWLGERLAPTRIAGLAIGFAGIVVLAWGKASFVPGGSGMAILAAIAGALSYGIAASYARGAASPASIRSRSPPAARRARRWCSRRWQSRGGRRIRSPPSHGRARSSWEWPAPGSRISCTFG